MANQLVAASPPTPRHREVGAEGKILAGAGPAGHFGAMTISDQKTFDELVRENPDAFDYPDHGNPLRQTGVATPGQIQKLIDARTAAGRFLRKPDKDLAE
jgi:hypothetical protein